MAGARCLTAGAYVQAVPRHGLDANRTIWRCRHPAGTPSGAPQFHHVAGHRLAVAHRQNVVRPGEKGRFALG